MTQAWDTVGQALSLVCRVVMCIQGVQVPYGPL